MSSQFGFIDIILLAMIAGFIILRLRNILGRRTGHQGKPINKYFPRTQILKDIELKLKSGLNENSCSRQREAAKIGIRANDSLLKAYKVNGSEPPIEIMESNKKRWVSILDNCHD